MELANCRVVLDKNGSDVEKKAITPAEAQVLKHLHHGNAGGSPIRDLKVIGYAANRGANNTLVERTDGQEVARLRTIYHKKTIDELFPGANPKVPQTFEEALKVVDQRPAEPEAMGAPVTEALPLRAPQVPQNKPAEPGK